MKQVQENQELKEIEAKKSATYFKKNNNIIH